MSRSVTTNPSVLKKAGGLAGIILLLVLFLAWKPTPVQAHASFDHSNPSPNTGLPTGQAPGQVQVWFAEEIEFRFSQLQVTDAIGQRVDKNDLQNVGGDKKSLQIGLKPGLPDGDYTVLYRNVSAEDGHAYSGSFVFAVGGSGPVNVAGFSPIDQATQANNDPNLNANFWSVALRWLNYLSGAALVGALLFWLLVWHPVIKVVKASGKIGPQLSQATEQSNRRVQWALMVGVAGLALGWVGWLLYEATLTSQQNLGQVFGLGVDQGGSGPKALTDFLFGSRYGLVWSVRLVLIILTTALLLAFNSRKNSIIVGEHGGEIYLNQRNTRRYWGMVVFGGGVLLTTSLNSHAAGVAGIAPLAVVADWLHLLATSIWIGGVLALSMALSAAIPALLPGTGDRTRLLATLIPYFSRVAILSVMVLLLTGTLGAALQLGDLTDLVSSAYGLSLTIKIALMFPLLLLGAYNLLVVSPRLRSFARSKKAGPKEGAGSVEAGTLGRNFRRSVWLEVALGVIVLAVAAFLTSSAPPRAVAGSDQLYFSQEKGGLKVELAVNPGQVGNNVFEVRLTDSASGQGVSNARRVVMQFEMVGMDMGSPNLELKPVVTRPGRYTANGPILSMVGEWKSTLLVQRDGKDDLQFQLDFRLKR